MDLSRDLTALLQRRDDVANDVAELLRTAAEHPELVGSQARAAYVEPADVLAAIVARLDLDVNVATLSRALHILVRELLERYASAGKHPSQTYVIQLIAMAVAVDVALVRRLMPLIERLDGMDESSALEIGKTLLGAAEETQVELSKGPWRQLMTNKLLSTAAVESYCRLGGWEGFLEVLDLLGRGLLTLTPQDLKALVALTLQRFGLPRGVVGSIDERAQRLPTDLARAVQAALAVPTQDSADEPERQAFANELAHYEAGTVQQAEVFEVVACE